MFFFNIFYYCKKFIFLKTCKIIYSFCIGFKHYLYNSLHVNYIVQLFCTMWLVFFAVFITFCKEQEERIRVRTADGLRA